MKLFDGGDSFEEDISKIEIDKDYARRFEHNKKREDLQKLDELKKKGIVNESSDESSEDEYDDSHLVDPKKDLQFLNALIKAKKGDLSKDKEVKLFESEDEEDEDEDEDEEEGRRGKSVKPMYLKDVTAKHLIEEGPEFDDVIEESKGSVIKSHSEEMEEMRRAFIDEANAAFCVADGDGELLMEKKRGKEEIDNENDQDIQVLCDEAFGVDDNLDEDDKFLKEYIKNRFWIGDEKDDNKPANEDVLDFSEDEEVINQQEKYEIGYNFRHEESAGDRVLGHSRVIEGSVRKKTNARKTQRERKEERLAQAEFERKEELKHLKNLKKKEMKEKLEKIRETAGIVKDGFCPLDVDDLEKEFDPDEYDRKMREAFNDEYYDAVDANPNFETDDENDDIEKLEKPDFDKEDELLGLQKGWSEPGNGFLAAREKYLKSNAKGEVNDDSDSDSDDNEKQKRGKVVSTAEKEILDKELDEYYKLDYEDTIGDLKTRFKYKEVGSKRYGLTVEEILMLDDNELNQYVSLKKLAPYVEKEWKVPREKRYQQKQRNRMLLLEAAGLKDHKYNNKKNQKDDKGKSPVLEEGNDAGGESKQSSRSRKRKRQAELKLSRSRLMAYGKIPSSSGKSKKK
ncbi:protein KRI1 homolog [Impatiens glandulifera]|uniref:protein KRI1 homolog n=1 Tax=Impatiens glandulifera TaxID=253017 RepID=UPI001FB089E1|nr:protein KRI1 homolog [Impatiens glandulifera]XP_047340467.1 protein KRI1 homolog [Impatiens glandulifera]